MPFKGMKRWELKHDLQVAIREIARLEGALARAQGDGGWLGIAQRQSVYIKALEERLAGTWNPADTHQQEYDAMYAERKARN